MISVIGTNQIYVNRVLIQINYFLNANNIIKCIPFQMNFQTPFSMCAFQLANQLSTDIFSIVFFFFSIDDVNCFN